MTLFKASYTTILFQAWLYEMKNVHRHKIFWMLIISLKQVDMI